MFFEEIKTGMKRKLEPVKIDRQEMIDFALRFDNVPIHTDESYAEKTHFGQIIAPGYMSFLAVWASYLDSDIFGEELIAGKSSKIEWFKPVFAGDILSAEVTVSGMTERNERNGIVEITIEAVNQNGDTVLKNITEAVIKRRPSE